MWGFGGCIARGHLTSGPAAWKNVLQSDKHILKNSSYGPLPGPYFIFFCSQAEGEQ